MQRLLHGEESPTKFHEKTPIECSEKTEAQERRE